MINALKLVTIQRGHDPRDLTLIATGGGGPMHAATLGRELGVKHVACRATPASSLRLGHASGKAAHRPAPDASRCRSRRRALQQWEGFSANSNRKHCDALVR